jgi:hypothetical protein
MKTSLTGSIYIINFAAITRGHIIENLEVDIFADGLDAGITHHKVHDSRVVAAKSLVPVS